MPTHPGEYIRDEMRERGWSEHDLAVAMGGGDVALNECLIGFLIHIEDKCLILDADTAAKLARAFGTSAELWMNLDQAWRLGVH